MNAHQRRKFGRRIRRDHFRWPLGTQVKVMPGHHSERAVGLTGRVFKHGHPCKEGRDCIVEFPHPVLDVTFGNTARFCHYVRFKHLARVKPATRRSSGGPQ